MQHAAHLVVHEVALGSAGAGAEDHLLAEGFLQFGAQVAEWREHSCVVRLPEHDPHGLRREPLGLLALRGAIEQTLAASRLGHFL